MNVSPGRASARRLDRREAAFKASPLIKLPASREIFHKMVVSDCNFLGSGVFRVSLFEVNSSTGRLKKFRSGNLLWVFAWLTVLMLLSHPAYGGTATSSRPTLTIPRVQQPVTIAQLLDDHDSIHLVSVTDFIQHAPYDGRPVSQKTTAYLAYDQNNLYVGFVCHDDKLSQIHADVLPRDGIGTDDEVGIIIDTYNSHQRAYRFLVNPLGIQYDALVNQLGYDDSNFDTLWYSHGHLTPWGYVALIRIPFRSLRFPPSRQQTWGIILQRNIAANSETSTWPAVPLSDSNFLSPEADLKMTDISSGKNIQFIPYSYLSSTRLLNKTTDQFVRQKLNKRVGVDGKWVFGSNMTLDATVNPDFSQVESDQPQITVNQRFEVYFPEKRPFFMENSDFFTTPIDVLFTRRIADPQYGLRLTGKTGHTRIGALIADDRSPGEIVPPGNPAFGKRAIFDVLRMSHDVGKQSSVGFIWSDREFMGSSNRVVGPDATWRISKTSAIDFQFLKTFTHDLAGHSKQGTAANIDFVHSARHWDYSWNYQDRSPNFEVDSGFIPRVDYRSTTGHFGYTFRPENRWVISWQPFVNGTVLYDYSNVRQDYEVDPGFWAFLGNKTDSGISYYYHRERFQGTDFLWRSLKFHADNKINRWFAVNLTYQMGQSINISPAEGLVPFLGQGDQISASFTVYPVKQLVVTNTYLQSRLLTIGQDRNIFNNNIFRTQWNYQFSRRLALRFIGQYNNVLPSKALSSLAYTKQLSGDILLTYLVHPGTALYIGYNNMLENYDRYLLEQNGVLARSNLPLLSTAAGLFVKFEYLFQY